MTLAFKNYTYEVTKKTYLMLNFADKWGRQAFDSR